MPSISCPYCRHVMELKGVHAGRFKPACPECRAQFQLTISADPKVAPEVLALGVGTVVGAEAVVAGPKAASVAGATVVASASRSSTATVVAPPMPPTIRDNQKMLTPLGGDTHSDPTVPVGLGEKTVEQLSRTPPGPVTPKWEAAATASGHNRLGGYEIIKTLGEGGMGRVYLANQTSLARNVALKVLSPKLASDAQFVSRFTREAFAAAQLTHHNVVQIHDIGVDRAKDATETNYFSMEFVEGQTLAKLIDHVGRLDPATAVGYVLQAARGLKFAHDHGLIHRDIKPDNLLLNSQGIVKVADLGLVKRAGAKEQVIQAAATLSPAQAEAADAGKTLPSAVMGTPAYMPPEQAIDAGMVDARADIYSLGCTLYHLLTGHAPFGGRTVDDIIKAHGTQQMIPPDRVMKDIPPALSQIVMKMTAKKPEERYADMGEVVTALEHCLGIESEKPFAPEQEQLKLLELSADRFNTCPWKSFRKFTILGFFIASVVAIVVLALPVVGHPLLAAGLFGYVVTAVVSYQIIYGLARRTYLMQKFREMAFASNFADWAQYVLFAELGVGLLIAFGLHWVWLGFSVGAVLSAFLFYVVVDSALSSERRICLEQTEKMLRALRAGGTDENTIRHFVCRYCGKDWEEFYEALFGFEAKLQARQAWNRGELGRTRPRFGAWREPVVAWIERHIEAQREEKQRKMLLKIEVEALKAKGLDAYEANIQAKQAANRLIDNAAAVRAAALKRSNEVTAVSGATAAKVDGEAIPKDWMHDGTEFKTRRRRRGNYFERRYGTPFDILFGRAVRLLAAMLILICFGLWWSNNGANDARNTAVSLAQQRDDISNVVKEGAKQAMSFHRVFRFSDPGAAPLRINHLPTWLCDALGCWNGAIAGILLLMSVFFNGRLMGFTVLMAATTALFGRQMPISMFSETEWLVPATAVGIWLVAILFLRDSSRA
jgi:serine/threonine protein kinase